MSQVAKHIFFSGRVQGVGFRFAAHRIANRYQLTGFVRNTADGRVEVLVQGGGDDVKNCLGDIEETFGNYIREVEIEEIPPRPQYQRFQITF